MAKVLGIGGVFFKCKDPAALAAWYRDHLGFDVTDGWNGTAFQPSKDDAPDLRIVWGPFKQDTDYFQPSGREAMINFRVDDLQGVLEKVRAGGAELAGEIESYDYGRFGWFIDPEGYKIELWQPIQTGA
ncbi:VOC family protein [Euryhalocaulis caribicus]|uniref:VOC family protein n=1 Tax=Euryhalocaulis caribicus TaxID=1161401 RepID=UPI0003A5B43A|nr:VOC family protein [Euryhalocaulis caribicus]